MTAPIRRGTLAWHLTKAVKVTVRPVSEMPFTDFLRHCRERHPNIPFVKDTEHQALHRLQPPSDHTHTDMLPETTPESDSSTRTTDSGVPE